jgi:hypothetical protein
VHGQIAGKNQRSHFAMSHSAPARIAFQDPELVLNNNYHLVHHDLPHVPWFALREVYETSRQQYIYRSGGFLVNGYSEWLRHYSFARVAHPVYRELSDLIQHNPSASNNFAGKLRVKFMIVIRRGELHEADLPAVAERQTARQTL